MNFNGKFPFDKFEILIFSNCQNSSYKRHLLLFLQLKLHRLKINRNEVKIGVN